MTAVGEVAGGGGKVGCDWRGGRGRDINGLGKRRGEGNGKGKGVEETGFKCAGLRSRSMR